MIGYSSFSCCTCENSFPWKTNRTGKCSLGNQIVKLRKPTYVIIFPFRSGSSSRNQKNFTLPQMILLNSCYSFTPVISLFIFPHVCTRLVILLFHSTRLAFLIISKPFKRKRKYYTHKKLQWLIKHSFFRLWYIWREKILRQKIMLIPQLSKRIQWILKNLNLQHVDNHVSRWELRHQWINLFKAFLYYALFVCVRAFVVAKQNNTSGERH